MLKEFEIIMVKEKTKYNWKERQFIFAHRKALENFYSMFYGDAHQSEDTFGFEGLMKVVNSSTIYGCGGSRDRPVNAL